MSTIIPRFIQKQFKQEKVNGSFKGYSLFMDIAGFTRIIQTVMAREKEGERILSEIMDRIYTPVVQAVYDRGGFIASFAGDSFTALFPVEDGLIPLDAGRAIGDYFTKNALVSTGSEDFSLAVTQGFSYGEIEWRIIEGRSKKNYYFSGLPLKKSRAAQRLAGPGEIVIDEDVKQHLSGKEAHYKPLEAEGYFVLKKSQAPLKLPETGPLEDIEHEVARQFFPEDLINMDPKGSFKKAAGVFIACKETDDVSKLARFITALIDLAEEYGGFVSGIDQTDKNTTVLVLFGAPADHENDLFRAANFSLTLIERYGDMLKIGFSYGGVYAGFTGSALRSSYTALGFPINRAAGIIREISWGAVGISRDVYSLIHHEFTVKELGSVKFGENEEEQELYSLLQSKQNRRIIFEGPIFSREKELGILKKRIRLFEEEAFAGIVYVYGGPGTGKSKLLYEFTRETEPVAERVVLQAEGILQKSMNPFVEYFNYFFGIRECKTEAERKKEFARRIEQFTRRVEQHSHREAKDIALAIRKTVSCLGALLGLRWEKSIYEKLDPEARLENTLDGIKAFFKAKCLFKPLILILEDLQWLDEDSKKVFERLTTNIDNFPILICASSRTVEGKNGKKAQKPVLPIGGKVPAGEVILEALNQEAASFMAAGLLGGPPEKDLTGFIYERTAGNPFYIDQLCRFLVEEKRLRKKGGLICMGASWEALPATLNELLLARIDKLGTDMKNAVQVISVLGREFEVLISSRMLPGEDMNTILEKGETERVWGPLSRFKYIFHNLLLRDVVYKNQLGGRLRVLHGRAAGFLEEMYQSNQAFFPDIAFHYEHAELIEKAIEYYRKAAIYARDNFKNDKAIHFFTKLTALTAGLTEKIGYQKELALIYEQSGRWEQALKVLDNALKTAREEEKLEIAAELLVNKGEVLRKIKDYENAESTLKEAEELLKDKNDSQVLWSAYLTRGRNFFSKGELNEALKEYNRSMNILKKQRNFEGFALVLYYAGVVFRDKGNKAKAMELFEKSFKIFSTLENKQYSAYPLYDMGIICRDRGELDKANDYFEKNLALYRRMGHKSGVSTVFLNLGLIKARKGLYNQAFEDYTRAMEVAREAGEAEAVAYAKFLTGTIYYYQKEYELAANVFEDTYYLMKDMNIRGYFGYPLSYLVTAYAKIGDQVKALQYGKRALIYEGDAGLDVEKGRSYLGIAMALAADEKPAGDGYVLLHNIITISGLERTPEAFFQKAVNSAREANYVHTLVPSLIEYARYLYGKTGSSPGEQGAAPDEQSLSKISGLVQEAYKTARAGSMVTDVETIKELAAQWNIAL